MRKFNVNVNGKSYAVEVEEVGGVATAPAAVAPAPAAVAPAVAPLLRSAHLALKLQPPNTGNHRQNQNHPQDTSHSHLLCKTAKLYT